MDDLILYGPPGTGKTTSGLNWMEQRIDAGADPRRVAFVSFTNAAVNEATSRIQVRFGIDPDELPYCRTLHSLCKRACGISGDWLADKKLDQFAQEYGYDLKPERRHTAEEDDIEQVATKMGRDAPFLNVWDFARHRLHKNAEAGWDAFAQYSPEDTAFVPRMAFVQFVSDYEAWKIKNGLRDHTDLLAEYLSDPVPLNVSVAIVDEAQDLSPLMWACVDQLFADAEYRAVLGDDDQAIYSYAGAEPRLMNNRQSRQRTKLRQSYRLPRQVTDLALSIIGQNFDREEKAIDPTGEEGEVSRLTFLEDADLLNGESWFVLARNWRLLDQVTPQLENNGIPYLLGGKRYSPWSDRGPLKAVRTLLALSQGRTVTLGDVQSLAQKSTTATKEKPWAAWKWGAKKRIQDDANGGELRVVSARDLHDLGMTEWGLKRVLRGDLSLISTGVSERDILAYQAAIDRGTLWKDVQVTLSSIHARKGQEADNVIAMMACTGGTARALSRSWRAEEERRCAYVAATRAKKRFFGLVAQPTRGIFPWELFSV